MRQWWELKTNNFDVLMFFKVLSFFFLLIFKTLIVLKDIVNDLFFLKKKKVGKFYELYHMDAVTAIKELGLTLMRVRPDLPGVKLVLSSVSLFVANLFCF